MCVCSAAAAAVWKAARLTQQLRYYRMKFIIVIRAYCKGCARCSSRETTYANSTPQPRYLLLVWGVDVTCTCTLHIKSICYMHKVHTGLHMSLASRVSPPCFRSWTGLVRSYVFEKIIIFRVQKPRVDTCSCS
jgi:hypothetical protein